MLSHSIYSFRHLFYLRVHVLSTEPSSILFEVLFVRFSRIFTVPLTPPISITIAAPLSFIFSPWTIISGRLSPLFLAAFPFLPVIFFIFFFSHWLFILLPYLSRSFILYIRLSHHLDMYRFNYSFNLYFLFKFLFGRISHDICIYLVNDSYLKKNGLSQFRTYFPLFFYVYFSMSLISCSLPSNQLYKLRSHTIFPRFFYLTNTLSIYIEKVFFPSSSLSTIFHSSSVSLPRASHVSLVHPLSVTLFFSFLLVARLRLSFHSFVFNRTTRRWFHGFLPCCQLVWWRHFVEAK